VPCLRYQLNAHSCHVNAHLCHFNAKAEARTFFAHFDRDYEYKSYYISTKTKLTGMDANRECICDVLMGGRTMQALFNAILTPFNTI